MLDMGLKITILRLQPNFPGANGLNNATPLLLVYIKYAALFGET